MAASSSTNAGSNAASPGCPGVEGVMSAYHKALRVVRLHSSDEGERGNAAAKRGEVHWGNASNR